MAVSNVFTIPAHQPFLHRLAEGILARYGNSRDELSTLQILLPNRRSCRLLLEIFASLVPDALLLPTIRPIGETEEETLILNDFEFPFFTDATLLPAISRTERLVLLADLIKTWQWTSNRGNYSPRQLGILSYKLARFLDEVQRYELDLQTLPDVVLSEHAAHWQVTVDFFSVISEQWPALLHKLGLMDPVARQVRLVKQQIKLWKEEMPDYPIIVAGSTGSIPSTFLIMDFVSQHQKGCLVFPHIDSLMAEEEWKHLTPVHPQYTLSQTLTRLSIKREYVQLWNFGYTWENAVSTYYHTAFSKFYGPQQFPPVKNYHYYEAENIEQEAEILTLIIREVLEQPGKTLLLATQDRILAQLIKSKARRFLDLPIDDSSGISILKAPIGIALCHLMELALSQSILDGLSVLKNAALVITTKESYGNALANLERQIRHFSIKGTVDALSSALAQIHKNPYPFESIEIESSINLVNYLSILLKDLNQGKQAFHLWAASFYRILQAHFTFGDAKVNQSVYDSLETMIDQHYGSNGLLSLGEFIALIQSIFSISGVREAYGYHLRIAIATPQEARLLSADYILLAGVNMGSWPEEAASEWMSHAMRSTFGLPDTAVLTGLAAYDFIACASKENVYITRSKKREGKIKTASPWLLRMAAIDASDLVTNLSGEDFLYYAKLWACSTSSTGPYKRPSPKPPVSSRPNRLSVTEIETWLRDPYSVYAKKILNLIPLRQLEEDISHMDYGNKIHLILERFIHAFPYEDEMKLERLIQVADSVFALVTNQALAHSIWKPRFQQMAPWLIKALKKQALYSSAEEKLQHYYLDLNFTLTAKADRIDYFTENCCSITDYKTGTILSLRELYTGYLPQLPLEALLKQYQESDVREISYWWLKGYDNRSLLQSIEGETLEKLIEHAETGIRNLVLEFKNSIIPYISVPDTAVAPAYPQYDRLARTKEWHYQ